MLQFIRRTLNFEEISLAMILKTAIYLNQATPNSNRILAPMSNYLLDIQGSYLLFVYQFFSFCCFYQEHTTPHS